MVELGVALKELGVHYLGLEHSRIMSSDATRRGIDVRQGGLAIVERNPELANQVQVFVLIAMFEHLADPGATLRRIARILPPDGALVIQCPTAGIPRMVGKFLRTIAPAVGLPSIFGSLAPPWHVCPTCPRQTECEQARGGSGLSSRARNPRLQVVRQACYACYNMRTKYVPVGDTIFLERAGPCRWRTCLFSGRK